MKNYLTKLNKYFGGGPYSDPQDWHKPIDFPPETHRDLKIIIENYDIPPVNFDEIKSILEILIHTKGWKEIPAVKGRKDINEKEVGDFMEYMWEVREGNIKLDKIIFKGTENKRVKDLEIKTPNWLDAIITTLTDDYMGDIDRWGAPDVRSQVDIKPGPKREIIYDFIKYRIEQTMNYLTGEMIIKTKTGRRQFIAELCELAGIENFSTERQIRSALEER